LNNIQLCAFSALTLLVEWQEEHPAHKNWVMGCWCGYQSDLHLVHPSISCFIKIQNDSAFLVPAYPGFPGREAVKWV